MRCALRVGVCAAAILAPAIAASAADLAVVPPISPAPPWSWTGVYAGFHFASGFTENRWSVIGSSTGDENGSGTGVIGGGQFGLNYQTGSLVWGAEVAFGLADINAQTACARAPPLPQGLVSRFDCTTNIDGLGTATGRMGYAFDQFLLYGKGGAAAEHVHYQLLPFANSRFPTDSNGADTRWGWTAGTGVEFAFSPTLSAFAEYDFMDFGNRGTSVVDGNGGQRDIRTFQSVHLVKVGLNYKLGQDLVSWTPSATVLRAWPAASVAWNWSGVYVGGHVGGGWGATNWNSATGLLGSGNGVFAGTGPVNGFAIGGQIGANYQFGPWVVGAEADASWADLDGGAKCGTSDSAVTAFTCRTRINTLGTLTGRFGQTLGKVLVYGKAGAAWDDESHVAQAIAPRVDLLFADNTRWGWTLGVGLEYAFTPAWSGKVEYNYLNFADKQLAFNGDSVNAGLSQNLSIVKMGFNYKLGVDPTASSAAPGPMWVKAPVLKAPAPSDWTIEAGARYWVSSGRKQLDLFGSPASANLLLSRLIYENVAGQAAEGFARLDHRDGMFLKGNFGLGDLAKGQFYDEDVLNPPLVTQYSNTLSVQRDGRTIYGSLDVGHAIVRGAGGDIGAYVGYRQFYERENAFGVRQLASNQNIQGGEPFQFSLLSLTLAETWSGAAVGLNARAQLNDRWRLEVDAALLPFVGVWNIDNHWQRADFNPNPALGYGWGSQFEAILSYALTEQWSIGAGGRYWYFATSRADSVAQTIKLYSERYGGFVQASYKFDPTPSAVASQTSKPPAAAISWTGIYAGANLGAGFGRAAWSDPFGPVSIGDQNHVGGALLGGQAGANYQIGAIVYGIEAAGSWAPLTGTASCFAGNPNQVIAGQDCGTRVGALAMLTGRVGYAVDRTLYYAKAGPAWGHSTFDLNFAGAAPEQLASTNVNRWGWTIGGGVEHALTREWSIVGEYKYVDLGSASVSFAGVPAALAPIALEAINQRYQVLTLGMNYKLN
jgi:opacity protein-like surface antigen